MDSMQENADGCDKALKNNKSSLDQAKQGKNKKDAKAKYASRDAIVANTRLSTNDVVTEN